MKYSQMLGALKLKKNQPLKLFIYLAPYGQKTVSKNAKMKGVLS